MIIPIYILIILKENYKFIYTKIISILNKFSNSYPTMDHRMRD